MRAQQEDSRVLVNKAKAGDRSAFDRLVGKHREHLEAAVRARLGEELKMVTSVEDVLQETLLRAFQSIRGFRGDDNGVPGVFFRWLRGIAIRVVLEMARNRKRNACLVLDFDLPADGTSPTQALRRKERLKRFDEALAALSPEYRTVLRLVRIEGLSVNETARRMDRTPNAVSHLLLRALQKLRGVLGDSESFTLPDRDEAP